MVDRQFLEFGEDVYIHEDVVIKFPELSRIGSHVAIDKGCKFSPPIEISNYVHIAPDVVVIGAKYLKLVLKDFSFIAAGTKVVCGSEDYTGSGLVGPTIPLQYRELIEGSIILNEYSGCGVNCSIMPGVTFGEGAVLGANSLAVTDLKPWTIYVGSPARPVKKRVPSGKMIEGMNALSRGRVGPNGDN